MPAYVRLLSYFSNFILLASFLGIGVGCLLASRRRNLFALFPPLLGAVVLAVDKLRLEVTVPSSTSIYFSSGTAQQVTAVESTMLLPLLFISVAALFVTIAQRMGRELSARPPLRAYTINLLGSLAGAGTDVPAAIRHGAKHVDAVEIDPVILRLGLEHHPDRPYSDPRVTMICDDARHFLRTTTKRYDLVVFALIDSLTLQSSFSGVRLESYMFTEESLRAVRDHLAPRGVMALYNYFREKWLVDRLANTVTLAFGEEPRAYVHQDRAYLAVMLAGPRLKELREVPAPPSRFIAYGQPLAPSPAHPLQRDASIVPATDNWPFLYMRAPDLPRHYVIALVSVLLVSAIAVFTAMGGTSARVRWSWHFFFLGAGFMLLETKSIVQFALLWGSTWSSASLAIASVLVMALASAIVASRVEIRRRWIVAAALLALVAVNYAVPVGRVTFESRALESLFYGAPVFSPDFCARLLFSSSFKESSSTANDFGANLLGAMVGGVGEYLSLLAGYRFLLILVAACYVAAIATPRIAERGLRIAD